MQDIKYAYLRHRSRRLPKVKNIEDKFKNHMKMSKYTLDASVYGKNLELTPFLMDLKSIGLDKKTIKKIIEDHKEKGWKSKDLAKKYLSHLDIKFAKKVISHILGSL